MLNNLLLKNFKSFEDEDIKLSPLTLLTGLNSSGKSSVIQAIRMVEKCIYNNSPLLEGHGSLDELHSSFSRSEMEVKLDASNWSYSITHEKDAETYKLKGEESEEEGKEEERKISQIYISADRLGPQPNLSYFMDIAKIGERGENVLAFLDYYSSKGIVFDERLKPEKAEGLTLDYLVNGWLQYISPNVKFEYSVNKKSDTSYSTFNNYRATNVGFGLSYTLPVIVALLISTVYKNPVVLLENPEAHLHPKGQTELAKLIAKCVECGSQVIVETHSDHLVDGIRIYCKQHPGFNEKVLAHWFELDEDNHTQFEAIKFTTNGKFPDFCPQGFFDQFEINAEELMF